MLSRPVPRNAPRVPRGAAARASSVQAPAAPPATGAPARTGASTSGRPVTEGGASARLSLRPSSKRFDAVFFSSLPSHPDPFQRVQYHQLRAEATVTGVAVLLGTLITLLVRVYPELLAQLVEQFKELSDKLLGRALQPVAAPVKAVEGFKAVEKPVLTPEVKPEVKKPGKAEDFFGWPGKVISALVAAGAEALVKQKKRPVANVEGIALLELQRQEAAQRVAEARARVAQATAAAERVSSDASI